MRAGAWQRYVQRGFGLPRPQDVARVAGSGSLRLGLATVDITPALGTDVAGFGFVASEYTQGVVGRLRASLLLVEDARGQRVLLVGLDLLAGTRWLTEALAAAVGPDLGLGVDRVWLCASHTHAGPGHLFGERFYDDLASADTGFDAQTGAWMVERLADAARRAAAALVPGRLGIGRAPAWGALWQRSLVPFAANLGAQRSTGPELVRAVRAASAEMAGGPVPDLSPEHLAVHADVQAIWAEDLQGHPLGALVVVHGTTAILPAHLGVLSPDAFGLAAARMARALGPHAVVGLVAGAMGDVNVVDPSLPVNTLQALREPREGDEERQDLLALVDRVGRHLATVGLQACAVARQAATAHLDVDLRFDEVIVPGASGPGYRLAKEHQVGNAQLGGSELNRQPVRLPSWRWLDLLDPSLLMGLLLRRLLGENGALRRSRPWLPVLLPTLWWRAQSPKNHAVYDLLRKAGRRSFGRQPRSGDNFDPFLPLRRLHLGPWTLVGLPVEPSAWLSHQVRQVVDPSAPERVVVLGLTGGYVGYATTVPEYRVQDYEGAATLWGRDLGLLILDRVVGMGALPPRPNGSAWPGIASFDTEPRSAPVQHLPLPIAASLGTTPPSVRCVDDRALPPDLPAVEVPEGPAGDPELVALAQEVGRAEVTVVVQASWSAAEATALPGRLGEGWWVRLLLAEGEQWRPVQWAGRDVDDAGVPMGLRRLVDRQTHEVRWSLSARLPAGLVPGGATVRVQVAPVPGLAPATPLPAWRWRDDA